MLQRDETSLIGMRCSLLLANVLAPVQTCCDLSSVAALGSKNHRSLLNLPITMAISTSHEGPEAEERP